MVGAVAGSPGTFPTNWVQNGAGGLTRTIVGIGTENGLPYIDLRYVGTALQSFITIIFDNTISASAGQAWTANLYAKLISGNVPTFRVEILPNAGSATNTVVSLTTSLNRFSHTYASLPAGTTTVTPYVGIIPTIGAAYDFTIRIAAPQMELGAFATTFIPTTTAAVTRIKDDAQKTGVSSIIGQSAGTIFWDVNDVTGAPANTGNPDFGIRNTAFTNWIGITTNGFNLPFRVDVRATSGILISYTANITRAKAAVAWSSAGAVLYVNGVQVGTSAVNPNFSFDVIQMLGGIISYKTNQAALFPTRLTNAQLAELTTL
jgi:hypothetical protein